MCWVKKATLFLIIYFALSVTRREEHRPKMLENKVLRMIFAIKRDWRKLHKTPRGLYASPNIIRVSS